MLFVLIALWLIAILLLLLDPRSATIRWISAVAFTGGLGALAAVFDDNLLPHLRQASIVSESTLSLLFNIQALCSLTSYYGLPYSYLMLSLHYHPVLRQSRVGKWVPYLLLLPPIACILFTPGYTVSSPIDFPIVSLWAVPYIIAGSLLLALKKETLPAMQRTHLFTCLALIPSLLCFAVLNYLLPTFGFYRMWVYNAWSLSITVPFFIFTLFKYGLFGIRLLLERRKLDSTLRAITSGTAILNHAIKNDVGKMRLFSEKMRHYAEETNQPELLEDLQVIMKASEHIQEMIGRVHEQTQEIPLKLSALSLDDMIRDIIASMKPLMGSIQVEMNIPEGIVFSCDEAQVTETVTNVVNNAVDAMPMGGVLEIKAFITKKNVVLEVKDTGIGMEKNELKQVLEPFYTTKSGSRHNFGLGLVYCYNVMKKHGGSLELRSEKGRGTSVFLSFPANRLIPIESRAEELYGSNQTVHRRG
ncbi:HAMP domain-containing sensor histidine kinase [Paenibacillus sp. GP183]|uniref:sensor histidine kinase n=1 Tax=Paenibacillus sp. GP183 TaxID=1882751 RepID=UPI00089B2956|nr:HAMP domain-containing sensor histidine kinase [Paenibacillus sp. GP183]SEB70399.1 Signal transduction histidine kinase [Paenibacillus sp. GP183]